MCKLSFELRGEAEGCRSPKRVGILRKRDMSDVRPTKPGGRLDQRIEDRLQVERRAAYHLKHVAGGRLLLEGFAQLVQQPGVLDRDDSLVGESPEHLALLVRQWAGHQTYDLEGSDWRLAAHHWHDSYCAVASCQEVAAAFRKLGWPILRVGNIYHPAIEYGDAVHVVARERNGKNSPHCIGASRIAAGYGREPYLVPVRERDLDRRVRKEIEPTLHNRIEYRLGILERIADNLQDVGGRRLLLERFAQLVEQ